MGTIYQRKPGGTYYGYWTDAKGRHHRKSLRTHDQAVARVRLRQEELVSAPGGAQARHTLTDAIGDLLAVVEQGNASATWRSYKQKGQNLVDRLGDVNLADLSRDTVLAYVRQRKIERAADGTIHKELVVLRRALKEARERDMWTGDPRSVVPSIRVRYEPREKWLTPEQMEQLIAEIPAHRRLWVALAGLAGGSLSEVERTTVGHVDLVGKQIRIPGRKRSTRWRMVPLHPTLLELLRTATKDRAAEDPLVTRWPNVRRDLHVAVARINGRDEMARRRTKKPALPRVSPNDLRRTFASWLKQAGRDSLVVAHLMGHSSTRMVELVYGRLSEETYRDAVASMPRLRTPTGKRSQAPRHAPQRKRLSNG